MTVVITIIMIMILLLIIIIITLIINTTTVIVGIVLLDRIPQSQQVSLSGTLSQSAKSSSSPSASGCQVPSLPGMIPSQNCSFLGLQAFGEGGWRC